MCSTGCWLTGFAGHRGDEGIYEYRGRLHYDRLLAGIVPAEKRVKATRAPIGIVTEGMASPAGARDTYESGTGETYEVPLGGTVRKAA